MVTHPAPGNWSGTVANAVAGRFSADALDAQRGGIVHRLDKGTSGVLVVAKTRSAHERLAAQFAARQVHKDYVAITVRNPCGTGCTGTTIDAPIGRDARNRQRMTILSETLGGRVARSVVQTVMHDAHALLHVVRVRIETGRTHQIRVHLRHARAPVLGDDTYGARDVNARFASLAPRPMLHACRLQLAHPFSARALSVEAPLPHDMRVVLQ
ncbi:unnamed protein product, partial [Agarophyton chilense]